MKAASMKWDELGHRFLLAVGAPIDFGIVVERSFQFGIGGEGDLDRLAVREPVELQDHCDTSRWP